MLKRALILALASLFIVNPVANAHTTLVSSNPKSNAMLKASPKQISITFDDDLIKISGKNVSKISLSNTIGEVKLGATTINKGTITALLLKALPASKYKVTYRVVSSDGHPVSGSFNFWVH
jgi:methionine-rich copper-binding protein CopC